jgi:hypothetical protein
MKKFDVPVLLAAFLLSGCGGVDQASSAVADDAVQSGSAEESDESKAIDVAAAAKMNLKAKVKDGESIRYQNLFVSNSGGSLWALCGSINSKNSFGAYTGFKPFVAFADPDAPTVIEGETTGLGADMDRQLYGAANKEFCSKVVARF